MRGLEYQKEDASSQSGYTGLCKIIVPPPVLQARWPKRCDLSCEFTQPRTHIFSHLCTVISKKRFTRFLSLHYTYPASQPKWEGSATCKRYRSKPGKSFFGHLCTQHHWESQDGLNHDGQNCAERERGQDECRNRISRHHQLELL